MEVVDGLVQGFSRKIRKLLLEGAEGNGALVEVLGALRGLEAQAVLHKVVHPPVAVFAHMYPALAFVRGDQRQSCPGIGGLAVQMLCDGLNILLQTGNIRESPVAELLQNIPPPGIRHGQVCLVDVPAAIAFTGNDLSLGLKMGEHFFQTWFHFFSPFPLNSISASA